MSNNIGILDGKGNSHEGLGECDRKCNLLHILPLKLRAPSGFIGELEVIENGKPGAKPKQKKRLGETLDFEKELIKKTNFRDISNLNQEVLCSTGFYCIKLKENSKLPDRYQRILENRKFKFLYHVELLVTSRHVVRSASR